MAINNKMIKCLGYINDQLHEEELVRLENEHKESKIVGFFILQDSKMRTLEFYYNFFENYFDVTKFKELQTDTKLFYLALSKYDLYDCIRPKLKQEWNSSGSGDSTDNFKAKSTTNFVSRTCCTIHKKTL